MHNTKTIVINGILVSIESRAYILDGTIQPVYKYVIDRILVLTYYSNGWDRELYPVYHALEIWPKEKLDELLSGLLPL
jgi:hypothetical protein